MEFGLARGLSVNAGYDQAINDLYRLDEMNRKASAMAEAKAKMFADDLDFVNAANAFDSVRVKEYAKSQISKIGKFVSDNPDWATNVNKRMYLNQMKRELKDNPELLRGVASDKALAQLNADIAEVAKNPNRYNKKAYDDLLRQRDNYTRFGNQKGEEAAMTEGFTPFTYVKPQEFVDLSKTGLDYGGKIKNLKPVPLKNGRSGAWITQVDENELNNVANAFYTDHKEQFDQEYGINAIEKAKEFMRPGIDIKFNYGDNHFAEQLELMKQGHKQRLAELQAKAGEKGGGVDYYIESLVAPTKTAEDPTRLAQTFGTKIPHKIVNDDASIQIDNTGDNFFFNGDVMDAGYREDGKYQRTTKKLASGYVLKPIKWAVENGLLIDPTGFSDLEGYDESEIAPTWSKKASIIDVPVGAGKPPVKMIKINTDVELDMNNPGYQGKYNSLVSTSKQRKDFDEAKLKLALGQGGGSWTNPNNGKTYQNGEVITGKSGKYQIQNGKPVKIQ